MIPALLACGRVAATTADDLTKLGFDGKPVPELNYAPSLGLYLIRPNFRQNQQQRVSSLDFRRAAGPRARSTISRIRGCSPRYRRHPRFEARHRLAACERESTRRSSRP